MNNLKRLKKNTIIFVFLFNLIVVFLMLFSISSITKKQNKLALKHAQSDIQKNMIFRNWVSMHNGIYVTPTEITPPNPYLLHEKRDVVTTDGDKLTLMNPSYALREMMNSFPGLHGEIGHLTSLKLLNPDNKPDVWEENVLNNFEKKLYTEYSEIYDYKGEEQLRYMKALETKQECLKCHAHQGYNVGDIRGGMSISIPMKKYNDDGLVEKKYIIILHLFIMFFICIIAYILYNRIKKSIENEILFQSEIKRKEEILINQSKMASLGEMIGNIAHQWRQPLSVISTGASGLKVQSEFGNLNDKVLRDSLDGILHSANYLSQTIDDFRAFVTFDKQVSSFDVTKNIKRNLEILNGSLKISYINVVLDCEENLNIKNFSHELTQVFINIINNAKDALDENVILNKYIFISAKREDDVVCIKIKDNAGGISKDIIGKVFEPYFTTKQKSQGNGLGLYLAYKIVNESMNGTIEVVNSSYNFQDENYVGAEVIIRLPLHKS